MWTKMFLLAAALEVSWAQDVDTNRWDLGHLCPRSEGISQTVGHCALESVFLNLFAMIMDTFQRSLGLQGGPELSSQRVWTVALFKMW